MTDLSGKLALVTGANTGIGRVTALELARAGAEVILACRNEAKTRPAMDAIAQQTGNDRLHFAPLDLASLASVRACAEQVLERHGPLHLLINNAGLAGQRGLSADGFELTFGVNHLGHFLLTQLLLERLVDSAPARIVTVSSKAHDRVDGIDFELVRRPTRTFIGIREYAVSKLANILFTTELARRLEGSGVSTYAVHPGRVASDIWRRIPWPFRGIMTRNMISNEEGAQTTLHCAQSEEAGRETGLYYARSRPATPSAAARDRALAEELWRRSEQWVAQR
jgi:retinol dehydrogenase-12